LKAVKGATSKPPTWDRYQPLRRSRSGRGHLGGARAKPPLHPLQGDGLGGVRQGDRFHDEYGLQGSVERWRELREEIRSEVVSQAWNPRKQAFAQSYGSDELDASALLMPAVGFMSADDPRMVATVEAIQRELLRDGLVLRYQPRADGAVDGITSDEGVFLPCSFWLADVLAAQGRLTEARELFERLLDLRNDVGLLSEEYDPVAGRQLGNLPQAFTHLSLINTAMVISHGRQLRGGQARP
jgi:GH15 family glucan-1,4-alpha-glucosidase